MVVRRKVGDRRDSTTAKEALRTPVFRCTAGASTLEIVARWCNDEDAYCGNRSRTASSALHRGSCLEPWLGQGVAVVTRLHLAGLTLASSSASCRGSSVFSCGWRWHPVPALSEAPPCASLIEAPILLNPGPFFRSLARADPVAPLRRARRDTLPALGVAVSAFISEKEKHHVAN